MLNSAGVTAGVLKEVQPNAQRVQKMSQVPTGGLPVQVRPRAHRLTLKRFYYITLSIITMDGDLHPT